MNDKKDRRRDEWLKLGLDLLVEKGPSRISIPNLCEKAGRTTGSLYYHFKDIDDYTKGLFDFWETNYAQIKSSDILKMKNHDLHYLTLLGENPNLSIEAKIREFSVLHDDLRNRLKKIDKKRINLVKKLYLEKGYSKEKAADLSEFEYIAFLGILSHYQGKSKTRMNEIYSMYKAAK